MTAFKSRAPDHYPGAGRALDHAESAAVLIAVASDTGHSLLGPFDPSWAGPGSLSLEG